MPYVYSTATCDGSYVEYKPDSSRGHGHSEIIKKVTIKGGHGVATKNFVTPKGVMTKVTDEELEFLLKNKSFQRHVKAGFMAYDKSKVDPEKKAIDMAPGDNSRPLTPKDFEKSENSTVENRLYKGKTTR